MSDLTLVTGFPTFYSQLLVRQLLCTDPAERVLLLCHGRFQVAAEIFVRELPRHARDRITVLRGDPADMDLGLPGAEYRRMCAEVTAIHHLAGPIASLLPGPGAAVRALPALGHKLPLQQRENDRNAPIVAGTLNIIDFSLESPGLRRLCHHSSASVAGHRPGVVMEEDLLLAHRFADPRDEALARAEAALHRMRDRLQATVLRPSAIVGHSRTGEIDRFAGPYTLLRLLRRSPGLVAELLQLPHAGRVPIHLCPIDFVTEVAVLLARDPRAQGLTFHLTDPNPLSARALAEHVARLCEQDEKPGGTAASTVPPRLLRAVLRAPGIERLTRAPMALLEEGLGPLLLYNCLNTTRLLQGTGVHCPPLPGYLERLLGYMQRVQKETQAERADAEEVDPLD